ncbi:MAG: CDGSH iron-sulfur domain-containing protein [Anaerolineae bacterium]|nr:CDGSH iron-sulfur domain-containing protein [Anaerolineae bacterium]
MRSKIHTYKADEITVEYDLFRCIHAEECWRRLSVVFDPQKRPWIEPDQASPAQIMETVLHCPSGALHAEPKDTSIAESIPATNTIQLAADGPLYIRGEVTVLDADDRPILQDTRMSLCRCGSAVSKPLCDNAHVKANFQAPAGLLANGEPSAVLEAEGGALTIKTTRNGSLKVTGNFSILDGTGQVIFTGQQAWLCRCGGSANKPFCDGTHKHNGFTAD